MSGRVEVLLCPCTYEVPDFGVGFYLMADGYQGYNKVNVTRRCGFFAHVRRYFLEAIPKGHEKDYTDPAMQGVLYCDKLFAYERLYKEKGFPTSRSKSAGTL